MFRPAIGALLIAATLGMAAEAAAELPMSPIYRTDQSRRWPGEQANPVHPTDPGAAVQPAPIAAAKPEKRNSETAADAAPVVATAPIPPPPPTPPSPPAEAATTPSPTALPEHAAEQAERAAEQAEAMPLRKRHRAPRRHYAYSRSPYFYRYYGTGSAVGGPHLGPNPYSDAGD